MNEIGNSLQKIENISQIMDKYDNYFFDLDGVVVLS